MINFKDILKECSYKTSRSGGAGGQHVNKVETKVNIVWNIMDSGAINAKQKEVLLHKLKGQIDVEGKLQCQSQESRSQLKNKERAQEKLITLINSALKDKKKRKKTKPPKSATEKRIKVKRINSETKQNRKKVKW